MKLVFLLEEPSMKELLDIILPQILKNTNIEFITIKHQGKSDLKKSIQNKLRSWNEPNVKFIIVQDKDSCDCIILKDELKTLCQNANRPDTLIRIACTELESWYFGDIEAIANAYNKDLSRLMGKAKYRNPDNLSNAKQELQKLIPHHQQISGARLIGEHLNIENNHSYSFNVFVSGVRKCVDEFLQNSSN